MTLTPPLGFRVRLRDDVGVLDDGKVLIGGTPFRAMHLSEALFGDTKREMVVNDARTAELARRLLNANIAVPLVSGAIDAGELTVVIPVRDRADQLERALASLTGLDVIVVDDASLDPEPVHKVVASHGARLVVLNENLGPSGARNAGLVEVTTPYVAFVDSDVQASPSTLLGLGAHFEDPAVALVGPSIHGAIRSKKPRWFERYDAEIWAMTLGRTPSLVRAGGPAGWLPAAVWVARTDVLRSPEINGFNESMIAAEDVDLCWRLDKAGYEVRYDPGFTADHDMRPTLFSFLGRKFVYGTGSAALGERHGHAVAPIVLSAGTTPAVAAVLNRRWWSVPVTAIAIAWSTRAIHQAMPEASGGVEMSARAAAKGFVWALRTHSTTLVRDWWPAVLLLAVVSKRVRRMLLTAWVIDNVAFMTMDKPRLDVPTAVAGRTLHQLAYGAGVWWGAFKERSPMALAPRIARNKRR